MYCSRHFFIAYKDSEKTKVFSFFLGSMRLFLENFQPKNPLSILSRNEAFRENRETLHIFRHYATYRRFFENVFIKKLEKLNYFLKSI